MNKSLLAAAIAVALATATPLALAQITTSTSTGGAGGAGGAAAGGAATGGIATNSNNTSGVSNAGGGTAQGGGGGTSSSAGGSASAVGGSSQATAGGGNVGTVSTGGSSAQLGDVTMNYNVPSGPLGKAGLGVGVDESTGHIVTDNNFNYSGGYKLKNTPDVSLGGPASGPCNGFSGGVGVGLPGLSIGANMSTVDKGCEARETARVAAMLGRMDIANAVLENISIVEEAIKAKAARDVRASPPRAATQPAQQMAPATAVAAQPAQALAPAPAPAVTSPAQFAPAPAGTPTAQNQQQREAALKEQQRLAQEALQRQATMWKVNDTLKFTDATTQGLEKTPQQIMAEEAAQKQAAQLAEEQARTQATQLAEENARKQAAQLADENARKQAAQLALENARKNAMQLAEENARRQATFAAQDNARKQAAQVAEEDARRQAAQVAEENARRQSAQEAVSAQAAPALTQLNAQPNAGQTSHAAGEETARAQERHGPEATATQAMEAADKDVGEQAAPVVQPTRQKQGRPIDALEALNLTPAPGAATPSVALSTPVPANETRQVAGKPQDRQADAQSLKARAIYALSLDGSKAETNEFVAAEKSDFSKVSYRLP